MAERVTNRSGNTVHTCNPAKPGKPLPFGRKADEGDCARCDELRAGAAPRELGYRPRSAEPQLTQADLDAHRRSCAVCQTGRGVCTAYDW
jgi:hypothetical protein